MVVKSTDDIIQYLCTDIYSHLQRDHFWELYLWFNSSECHIKPNIMLILYISVFLKLISSMLHVVSCHIVLYLNNIYTNSNLKFLLHILCVYSAKQTYVLVNMCICTLLSCFILYNISWVWYGAVFHVSAIHYHEVSYAILVSHVIYISFWSYISLCSSTFKVYSEHITYISKYMCMYNCLITSHKNV